MPRSQSGSSGPTLRKSQRPCGRLQNCLARQLLAGGVPGPGVVVESFIEVIYTFTAVRNSQKRRTTGSFKHVLAYKSPKMPFFALKYLTRYTHEMFFEEYINFKIFCNLSHCGVIPVQSFGSHIRPQPHGLGLKVQTTKLTNCVMFQLIFAISVIQTMQIHHLMVQLLQLKIQLLQLVAVGHQDSLA